MPEQRIRSLSAEVSGVEKQFAQTMADRDMDAFAAFLSDDAVFRSGDQLLLGRAAVVDTWRKYFQAGSAPFSWSPDRVTVNDAGDTAVSSGPVRDPSGALIGRFTTIWRKGTGPNGNVRWRVIVDQGVPLLECPPPKT